MDWRKVSDYLEKQSQFLFSRAMESNNAADVRRYAMESDLLAVLAGAILTGLTPNGWEPRIVTPPLGDIEEKLEGMK